MGLQQTIHHISFNQLPTAAHNITFSAATRGRITLIAAAPSLLPRHNAAH